MPLHSIHRLRGGQRQPLMSCYTVTHRDVPVIVDELDRQPAIRVQLIESENGYFVFRATTFFQIQPGFQDGEIIRNIAASGLAYSQGNPEWLRSPRLAR